MKKALSAYLIPLVLTLASCSTNEVFYLYDRSVTTVQIILIAVFGIAFFTIPYLMLVNLKRKQLNSYEHLNDYSPSREDTFEEKLQKLKLAPEKVITFGQNFFAADSVKKKLLIQSAEAPDGVFLGFGDIITYELIKDGKVIEEPRGQTDSGAEANEYGIICSDLRLVIKTKKPSCPEVILPLITFSIDSEFAYREALDTGKEAAAIMDSILYDHPFEASAPKSNAEKM